MTDKPKTEAPVFTFEDDMEVPAPITKKAPSPFTPKVAELKGLMTEDGKPGRAGAMLVTDKPDVLKRVMSQLSDAGKENGVTVRSRKEAVQGGRVRIVFWPVPRITRERKPAETDAAETPAAETA